MDALALILVLVLVIGGPLAFAGGADVLVAEGIRRLVLWYQRVFLGIDKPVMGSETLVGSIAKVKSEFVGTGEENYVEGSVLYAGELWRARLKANEPSPSIGDMVVIVARDGLTLTVRRSDWPVRHLT